MGSDLRVKDTGARAICRIKQCLRAQPDQVLVIKDEADMPLAPIWNTRFKDTLGSLRQFLTTRPDQFLVKEDPEGYSVKDVTGNAIVDPTLRNRSNTPEPPRRRAKTTESPGGLAKRILGPILAQMRENGREHGESSHVVVGSRRRSRSRRRFRSRSRSRQPRSRAPTRGSGGSGGLRQVLGNWVDTRGSRYQVQLDERGSSCTVKTSRPDGTVRETKALIRLLPLGGVMWGDSYVLDRGKLPEGQLRWLRLKSASGHLNYVWKRA